MTKSEYKIKIYTSRFTPAVHFALAYDATTGSDRPRLNRRVRYLGHCRRIVSLINCSFLRSELLLDETDGNLARPFVPGCKDLWRDIDLVSVEPIQ